MGPTAQAIAIAYSISVVAGLAVTYAIWRSTRGHDKDLDEQKAAHREKTWLVAVVVFLVATLLGTIFLIPYGESAGATGQTVSVLSRQFGFQLTPATVQAGRPVEFHLTSEDTSHGFGVTTEDNKLLFQAQIPPGHEQHVVYTFDTPGTYKVVCMEYCGVGHHVMLSTLEVTS